MTNQLSFRAKQSIEILKNNGRFVQRLERNNYTQREQFEYRLLTAERSVVPNVGIKTFFEIENLLTHADGGTSVSTYYKLRNAEITQ